MSNDFLKLFSLHIIVGTQIFNLSITYRSARFVELSWKSSVNVTIVSYTYEVAYISRPDNTECSGDLTTLPDGYTVYPLKTTNNTIEVFGLMSGTCYAFGVRAYPAIAEFSVILGSTLSSESRF